MVLKTQRKLKGNIAKQALDGLEVLIQPLFGNPSMTNVGGVPYRSCDTIEIQQLAMVSYTIVNRMWQNDNGSL
jgi:hypothetical protein